MIGVEKSNVDYKEIITNIERAIYGNKKEVKITYKDEEIDIYILSGYNIYSENAKVVKLIKNINKILENENARNKFNLVECFCLKNINNFLRFLYLKLNRSRDINQFNEFGNFTNTIIKNKIFLVKIDETEEMIFIVFTNNRILVKNHIDPSKTCDFLLKINKLDDRAKISQVYELLSTEKGIEKKFKQLVTNLDTSQTMKIFYFLNAKKYYIIDVEYRLVNGIHVLHVLCPVEYLENCLHLTKDINLKLKVLSKEEEEISQMFSEFNMKKNAVIPVNQKYLRKVESAINGKLNDSVNNIDSTDTLSIIGQKIAILVLKVYLSNIDYSIQPFNCNKYHLEICIKNNNIIVTENYIPFFEPTTLMFLKVIIQLIVEESNKYSLLKNTNDLNLQEYIQKLNDVHVVYKLNSLDEKL